LAADAEVKVAGWWGRPEQLAAGERVWAWFSLDRDKRPAAVCMIADVPSEQDIHGRPPEGLEAKRADQKAWLRRHWLDQGLPATVTLLHPFSGEMELLFDHEAMRRARALTAGAEVTIRVTPPVRGTVRSVAPWRERTQVRLVVVGTEQAALAVGQRCRADLPAPAADVEAAADPPDADRPRSKA